MPRAWVGSPEYAIGIDDDDDDIIEMGPTRVIRSQNLPRSSDRHGRPDGAAQHVFGLVFPTPASFHSHASAAAARSGHSSRRTTQNPPPQPSSRSSRPNPQQVNSAAIIDLTEVPDSPPEQEPQILDGRNPRRTNSLRRNSPPRLSRSDSTSVGQDASVIDLTADSPEAARPSNVDGMRNRQRRHPSHPAPIFPDELIQFELFRPGPQLTRLTNTFLGMLGGRNVSVMRNFEPVRPPSPKPPMEPVPSTREGFTRDTRADPDKDLAVICPCCNDELAYGPNESATSTTGSRKRKRAPGDHHFWALKKCGHVYCAECFENRRPSKTSPMGAGFRIAPGKSSAPNPNDIRCVVEGCETKAAAKTEWVGIFL